MKMICLITCLSLFVKIGQSIDCNEFYHLQNDRDVSFTINDLRLGANIPTESRFDFECISNIHKSLSEHFEYRNGQLHLLESYINLYYPGDKIKILFLDKSWHLFPVPSFNKRKIIEITITPEGVVCDTITKIIYQNTIKNIEKLANGEVDEIDLFNKLIKDSIQDYLNSLPQIDTASLKELCINEFRILDWIGDSGNYGFKSKSYKLPDNVKSYLGIIARSISDKIQGKEISKKQIKIKCIGFADILDYGVPEKFDLSLTGFMNQGQNPFTPYSIGDSCKIHPSIYFDLKDTIKNNKIVAKLDSLESNCDLSTVRAFVTVSYLNFLLSENGIISDITFEYRGDGEIIGTTFAKNRRIETFMVLKTIE